MSTTIVLSKELVSSVDTFTKQLGFSTNAEFVNEAVRDKILELQKRLFFEGSNLVKRSLERNRISEQELVDQFLRRTHA